MATTKTSITLIKKENATDTGAIQILLKMKIKEIKLNTTFMRNCRKVQSRVGGTAGSGHNRGGVFERFTGYDVTWPDVFGDELHHLFAGCVAEAVTNLIRGRSAT